MAFVAPLCPWAMAVPTTNNASVAAVMMGFAPWVAISPETPTWRRVCMILPAYRFTKFNFMGLAVAQRCSALVAV